MAKRRKSRAKPGAKKGRPTKFNEIMFAKIKDCAARGDTDEQIAEAVGVSPRTIGYWKNKCNGFLPSLKANKDIADQLVEASLFQRAVGYSHPSEKPFVNRITERDPDSGKITTRTEIIVHHYIEHYPPDTLAAIYWLNNRQPERWRQKPPDNPGGSGEQLDNAEIVLEWDDEDSA